MERQFLERERLRIEYERRREQERIMRERDELRRQQEQLRYEQERRNLKRPFDMDGRSVVKVMMLRWLPDHWSTLYFITMLRYML